MTANIIYNDQLVNLSETWIDILSIEILRYLENNHSSDNSESKWHQGLADTCRDNVSGARGFGLSDLDLEEHASDEVKRLKMIDLLNAICNSYKDVRLIEHSTLNEYKTGISQFCKDIETVEVVDQFNRIIELLNGNVPNAPQGSGESNRGDNTLEE